jgi:Common central domain of tyrosinase
MGIRKNVAALTADEKAAFVGAVNALKARGQYDRFVEQHRWAFQQGASDPAHNGPAFLPWHREYLRRFERALQAIDPSVSLPYWDWTTQRSTTALPWTTDFLGGDGDASGRVTTGPFAHWTLTVRDPGDNRTYLTRTLGHHGSLPSASTVSTVQRVTPYDAPPWSRSTSGYRSRLEHDVHDGAHMWVGGSMMAMSSPNDPAFWLHHCNIDRLWAEWQHAHPDAPYVPPTGTSGVVRGHALDDPMPPWNNEQRPPTPASVINYPRTGFAYDTSPAAPTGPAPQGDRMQPGTVLTPGAAIRSASGRYEFVYQGDCNLVLYDRGQWLWDSQTAGMPAGSCVMQGDGNLVIYAAGFPLWDSGTWQHPGSGLVVQDDGNVVIYAPGGQAVWSTDTWVHHGPQASGDDMQAGEVLAPDTEIRSASGRYRFVYQGDGNLVLYDGGRALWASGTNGRPVGVCIMQGDGNVVVYGRRGEAIWDSGTWRHHGSRLVVQDDGNVVIYTPGGQAVWSTDTWVHHGPQASGDDMQPGEVLAPDTEIRSASGRYRFVYQGDGNLVLYDGGRWLWDSGTGGRPVGVCIMQGDGNLVVYARRGEAIWDSGTWQHHDSRLVVQDDGNVVIYTPGGDAVWATDTWIG